MKKALILWLIIFCGYGFQAMAASYAYSLKKCQELMKENPPQIEIEYSFGNMVLDNTRNTDEIEKIFHKVYPQEKSGKINGLTLLSPYAQLENSVKAEMISGRICYYPQNIKISIGYKPVVYIANDATSNQCRLRLIVRHEQTHLDIGHLSLLNFAQKLREEFPKTIYKMGPTVKAANAKNAAPDATAQQMNTRYHERLKTLFDSFVQNLVAENMRIDTAENYKRESALCPQN